MAIPVPFAHALTYGRGVTAKPPNLETPEARKRDFVRLVERVTAERLAEQRRRHNSCVAPGLGPIVLSRRFRADRLPPGTQLHAFAERLVDWALGLAPAEPRPYDDDDLE